MLDPQGLRVLAVGEKRVESQQTILDYHDTDCDFALLGLVGMMDPPRKEAVPYLFNSRHLSQSILNRRGFFGNPIAWWGIAAVVAFQVVFTYWPVPNALFHVAPLDAWMWLRVLAASFALLLLVLLLLVLP